MSFFALYNDPSLRIPKKFGEAIDLEIITLSYYFNFSPLEAMQMPIGLFKRMLKWRIDLETKKNEELEKARNPNKKIDHYHPPK